MTIKDVAAYLRAHDDYLILTHRGPDGDTLGCAAALCALLRGMGKSAALYENPEVTERYAPYVEAYWAEADYAYKTVVSVDMAALGLFPDNAVQFRDKVDFAIDHHPSYEGFAKESYVDASCAACGEILYELAVELDGLTAEVALPLYVAVSTDTGCFVYANVTANTHRVAAGLMAVGIDYRKVNKEIFRTKSKKRLALEGRLLSNMEFFDEGRGVIVQIPLSLKEELELTEYDLDDIASLAGLVEGTDCAITMKEKAPNFWKVSVRTGARVNATAVSARLGGGGHRMASGCVLHDHTAEQARDALIAAVLESLAAGE
ncbi:MAG: bifunctional oligoribonuclease/PAP phosphatase NrnA [Oscillospiraceae bacterium]|nr:bifunctional oligoribonuclease/PAP phosphatase NrnA [Oscillospiraceae bacterium]